MRLHSSVVLTLVLSRTATGFTFTPIRCGKIELGVKKTTDLEPDSSEILYPNNAAIDKESKTATAPVLPDITDATFWNDIGKKLAVEGREVADSFKIAVQPWLQGDEAIDVNNLVKICDEIDQLVQSSSNDTPFSRPLRIRALEWQRYESLAKLLRHDPDAYVATASFLSPSRIPRKELPNVQNVPLTVQSSNAVLIPVTDTTGQELVPDCELPDSDYRYSLLDKVLLRVFRNLVTKNSNGVTSDKPGLEGLLEQGRTFMLQANQTAEAQHDMVVNTLAGLMTPVLPPFYKIFMSGILPWKTDDGKQIQLGPWFYAPALTSWVTPTFFAFLVGPSTPNRRFDGNLGGLVVEKCLFLQQSNCKGLCLHQCKLPAQQFFSERLGLDLAVSPNFATQECQWSFGEKPLPPAQDPSFPKGCLQGCPSRQIVQEQKLSGVRANLCTE